MHFALKFVASDSASLPWRAKIEEASSNPRNYETERRTERVVFTKKLALLTPNLAIFTHKPPKKHSKVALP
jgi:hypothetical protein